MYYFCTYFDKNYLDKGLALYCSLVEHCQPFTIWVLCMDDDTYRILNQMKLPYVTLISIAVFEWEDTLLQESKRNRSQIEYYFTCTPSLILKVMERNREIDILTYLDADLFFFSPIEPLYRELRHGSILITEHRFPDNLKHLEKYGKYNVGILSFRHDKTGITCLRWWRDRCLSWCYDRLEDGKFADQKYLDDWMERFPNVIVSKNTGVNVAPWNIGDYTEQEIVVYHFHGLRRISKTLWDTNIIGYKTRLPPLIKKYMYGRYIIDLNKIVKALEMYGWKDATPIRKMPKLVNFPKKLLCGDYIRIIE